MTQAGEPVGEAHPPERRLHPASLLFDALQRLPRMLFPIIVLVPAALRSGDAWIALGPMAVITALFVLAAVIRFLRFSYRYEAGELVVRSGLFTRNVRNIPYARIQNLDASQNLLHRMFGVVVVHVQTGSGATAEASFQVIPEAALQEMRTRIREARGSAAPAASAVARAHSVSEAGEAPSLPVAGDVPDDDEEEVLLALGPRELILTGFVENRGLVLIAGALAVLQETGRVEEWIISAVDGSNPVVQRWASQMMNPGNLPLVQGSLMLVTALLVFLLFVRVLSTIWALVRLHDFKLTRAGNELRMQYGLLTRVQATIPLHRIQTVIIRERMLHRWLRRCTVGVETAGGMMTGDGAVLREAIAPILPRARLQEFLHVLHSTLEPDGVQWQPVHPRARGRLVRRSLVVAALVGLASALVIDRWAGLVFVIVAGVGVAGALRRARTLGWAETRDSLVVRDGAWTRTIRATPWSRIQAVSLAQNPVDLRMGMGRLRADSAGALKGTVVPFMPATEGAAAVDRLARRAAATAFRW